MCNGRACKTFKKIKILKTQKCSSKSAIKYLAKKAIFIWSKTGTWSVVDKTVTMSLQSEIPNWKLLNLKIENYM